MGVDWHGGTYLGMLVDRGDLFETTGKRRACGWCQKAYTGSEQFCPVDGKEIQTIPVEVATPRFAKYAEDTGYKSPEACWTGLHEPYDDSRLGFWWVDAMQEHQGKTIALGFRIGWTDSSRAWNATGREQLIRTPIDVLVRKSNLILNEADRMGLKPGSIDVFTSLYVSY